jgi:hypothetical protein
VYKVYIVVVKTPAVTWRRLLQGTVLASLASLLGAPSPWLRAVESNCAYLLRLEPDRLLHGYRLQAGLTPKGPRYGGWQTKRSPGIPSGTTRPPAP